MVSSQSDNNRPSGDPSLGDKTKKCLLSWHNWSKSDRDSALLSVAKRINSVGAQRLFCILAVHGNNKFIGTDSELQMLIKQLEYPSIDDGFSDLFFKYTYSLVSWETVSSSDAINNALDEKNGDWPSSKNLSRSVEKAFRALYSNPLAIHITLAQKDPMLLQEYCRDMITSQSLCYPLKYYNWLNAIKKCIDKSAGKQMFLERIAEVIRNKPETNNQHNDAKWNEFVQDLERLCEAYDNEYLLPHCLIAAVNKILYWKGEQAPLDLLSTTLFSKIVEGALASSFFYYLDSVLAKKQWLNFDRFCLETRSVFNINKWNEWFDKKSEALKSLLSEKEINDINLDSAQVRILASLVNTLRVTARAGSGKTRLLTALTYFLVDQYDVAPEAILLLAFNRNAAAQLEERLTKLLNIPAFPGARTFHSLAYGIARPEESVIFDQGEEIATKQLSLLVQDILKSQLNDSLRDDIYELFRRESAKATSTGAFLKGQAAYDFRRALDQFTLGGVAVKSRGEKFIGDFLFEHGLKFYYESSTRWGSTWYRPDFKIMTGEKDYIIWEHWAIDPDEKKLAGSRDWPEHEIRKYQAEAQEKREFWKAKGVPLLESCAQTCGERVAFESEIAAKLRPYFPNLALLPREERLVRMQEVHLSKLGGWLGQAIQRAQKRGWDAASLRRELATHRIETERERLFLTLLDKVFSAYEPRLDAENKIDFDRLFNRAIALMKANPPQTILGGKKTQIELRQLRYCLVDEAQDLSPQFIEAVTCLRRFNPALKLVFVGDDWQAINRFAGSDVELFKNGLLTRFGKCATPTLATNYRSVRKVVQAGNGLMQGQGTAAEPYKKDTGSIQLVYLDKVFVEFREESTGFEEDKPFRDAGNGVEAFFKALYQLAIPDLLNDKTVGVLFRTNQYAGKKLPDIKKNFIRLLMRMGWTRKKVIEWQRKKIRFSTAHSYKGAESQTIFIVNPSTGSFPLLNADSIELFRFFGDSLEQAEADERRLFYVAITRAEERLVFLTESRCEESSPYLEPFRDLIQIIAVPTHPIVPFEHISR